MSDTHGAQVKVTNPDGTLIGSSLKTPLGDSVVNETADAVKTLIVDSTGSSVPIAEDITVVDDAPLTIAAARGTPILFAVDDTSTDSSDEGDGAFGRVQPNRVQIAQPFESLANLISGNASNTDGASTSVIAAAGAGIKQYLTACSITNTSAVNTYCELKSGTTVMWTTSVPANGGVSLSWPGGLKPNAANEAWNFDMGAATTTAYCSMAGFKSTI